MPTALPPVDTSVKVPRGVLATSARAEEIHKAAYNTPDPPPAEGGVVPTNGNGAPKPTNPTPAPAPTPAPVQAAPAVAPPVETADDWKQRYTSTKGRLDTVSSELANTKTRLASLETLVRTLERPAPVAEPKPAPRAATKRVTDEDVKEYGEDMLKVVQKAALDAIEPEIERRMAAVRTEVQTGFREINSKVGGVERETAVTAHQRLLDSLDKIMDGWRVINRHPKFHTWLGLTDPASGGIRKNLLNDAVKKGDPNRAAWFYRQFLADEGVPAPTNGQDPKLPPSNGNGAPKVDLAKLAAPGRPAASGAAPVVPDNGGEIITRAQITAFYTNKAKNVYSSEEAARLEAEVFAAQKDGRIR